MVNKIGYEACISIKLVILLSMETNHEVHNQSQPIVV